MSSDADKSGSVTVRCRWCGWEDELAVNLYEPDAHGVVDLPDAMPRNCPECQDIEFNVDGTVVTTRV
jgi:hypothetical protein